jgi:phosphoribosylamine--glycine ligase
LVDDYNIAEHEKLGGVLKYMKILMIGRGAREHALIWKMNQSDRVEKIYCATGNYGIGDIAELVDIRAEDVDEIVEFVEKNCIDLTVVAPEISFVEGIVERFEERKLKIFGPSNGAFELEVSKAFAKNLMRKYDIPTANFGVFSDQAEAFEYLEKNSPPFIIKADGTDEGKGLIIARDEITARLAVNVILKDGVFGKAGEHVIIEELVQGQPLSVVGFTNGEELLGATTVVNYQRVYDGDRGPFSGGMGSLSPDPRISDELLKKIEEDFLLPTIRAMKKEERVLKGVLYMNLILTESGPKVVDFQTRFNDPATQVIIPRMKSDLVEVMQAILEGRNDIKIEWKDEYSVSVVAVSGGYPMKYTAGKEIKGLESVKSGDQLIIYHARTAEKGGKIISVGGRVLNVVALGKTLKEARDRAYSELDKVHFHDMYYRKDIADNILEQIGMEG